MKRKHYLPILITVLSLPVILPVGFYLYIMGSFWWFANGDGIKEQLGLLPPDEVCMIEDWQPTAPDDVDPRQFCNTTLKRNQGSPVDNFYNHN